MDRPEQQLTALLDAQQKVIEQIALGDSLEACLITICEQVELLMGSPDARSSILILEGSQLRHSAAPSIPLAFCDAIDGVKIGPAVGSCGTAVYTRKQIIVSDIATDPLWADYKSLALAYDLKACWSTPIMSSNGAILGSFAVYYTRVKLPEDNELALINRFTYLSGLAIERGQSAQRERQLQLQLQRSNEQLQAIIKVIPDLGFVVDDEGVYVDIYNTDEQLFFTAPENFLGRRVTEVLPADLAVNVLSVIHKTLASDTVQLFEYELDFKGHQRVLEGRASVIHHYGSESSDKRYVLWMVRDITERKQSEQHIEQLAFYDPLTRLPNRRLLADRLEKVISKVKRSHLFGALIFLDLDDFKRINDSLGHSVGDELLIMVAERLKPSVRDGDTIARVGGDEFVIVLDTLEPTMAAIGEEVSEVARRVLECLSNKFVLGEHEYKIRASLGISLIEGQLITAEDVLKRGDSAMYNAKALGGNRFVFYDPALQADIDQRLEIERELVTAIVERQFCTYFQPQLDKTGALIGAEALIRWNHPKRGLVSPLHFIPVAEQSGLIYKLQNIVLEDTCQLLVDLQSALTLPPGFLLSVNISACQFQTSKLDQKLMQILKRYDLLPTSFVLEITESILMDDVEETIRQMQALKKIGFKFSVDDFGTGYSSLAYLHAFPIDEIKIDKSFIGQMSQGDQGAAIVDSIISLSNHLGFSVIAEGIETAEQLEMMVQRPIKGMQGFFFAKPMPAGLLIDWVKENKNLPDSA